LRNKFLREQIAQGVNISNGSSLRNSLRTSINNSVVNSKLNSKNNSRESSLEKNTNVKGIVKRGIVKGLSRSNNSSTDVKGLSKLNNKSTNNSVDQKGLQSSRNKSVDKIDVKGVKVSHTLVQNTKKNPAQNTKNNQGQNNKNYNQINTSKKPKFNIDISVDKANENIKLRQNELKIMVERGIDTKSKSRSPDNKNKEKNSYNRYTSSPKGKSKLKGKYIKHDRHEYLSPDKNKDSMGNSDDYIQREMCLEKDKVKEMELMQITD